MLFFTVQDISELFNEKNELNNAWAAYLADKNVELSPGIMLVLVMGLIVIPKFYQANRERKEKKQEKSYQETIENKDVEIKNLKKKLNNAKSGENSVC